MAPKNNAGGEARHHEPSDYQKNLPGFPPGHSHPHRFSYSVLFSTFKSGLYSTVLSIQMAAGLKFIKVKKASV
jgi:hypothetical protein